MKNKSIESLIYYEQTTNLLTEWLNSWMREYVDSNSRLNLRENESLSIKLIVYS